MPTSDILALLNKCSMAEKKFILQELKKDIQHSENSSDIQLSSSNDSLNYESLITYSSDFIEDELYLKGLFNELESLNLCSPQSARPSTLFFSLKNTDHILGSQHKASQDLLKYPALSKLRQLVNRHSDVSDELDCCTVVCLSNNKQSIRLHADNESLIDQSHPIATVSLGATRKVEFVPFGSSYDHTLYPNIAQFLVCNEVWDSVYTTT